MHINKKTKNLLIAISLLILFVVLGYFLFKKTEDPDYINKQYIIDRFNDLSYAKDGAPEGGILISMIDMPSLCEKYKWTSTTNDCLKSPEECGKILNVADIDDWLTTILGGGTNCYNIATTYWRTDMPQYVFGPYKTNDMTIGVLLDITKIFDYIGCLYPMDSGTIARYNSYCSGAVYDDDHYTKCAKCNNTGKGAVCFPDIDTSKWVTSDKNKRKDKWQHWLSTRDSSLLGMGGCGKVPDNYTPGGLYGMPANQWINVTPTDSKKQLSDIQNLKPEAISSKVGEYIKDGKSFTISNDNIPFDKYNWGDWVEATKKLYSNAQIDKSDYVNSQYDSSDGYRENEVDLIIPNKSRNPESIPSTEEPCQVQEDFKKIFINSIMGIVSLAEDNCSNSPSNANAGPGGMGCVDGKDNCNLVNDPNLPNSIGNRRKNIAHYSGGDDKLANPFLCLSNDKNNCFDTSDNDAWCYISQSVPSLKCCCSTDFSEQLVKKLVDNFNNSSLRKNAGAKKIHGYKMRCESIYNFSSYVVGKNKNIELVQIT